VRRSRRLSVSAAVALGVSVALLAPLPAQASSKPSTDGPRKVVSAYFADWDVYGRSYFVKDIPATKLNVIQYAFGVPTLTDGVASCDLLDPWADYQRPAPAEEAVDGVADDASNADQHLFGNFNQLRKLKAANPGLKVEISLGGWTKSTYFSSLAATAELRRSFVASCIDTFIKGDLPGGGWPAGAGGAGAAAGLFDGIDLDWEYPTQVAGGNVNVGPADRHNATLLAAEFRRQLDAYGDTTGRHYLLTAALPAATSSTKYYELRQISRYLDWDNVMTYDFNVPSGPKVAHNTLFTPDPRDPNARDLTWNTAGTVAYYLLNGVPANKIVVGVPFYAQQYLRTGTANHGLYTAFDNTGTDPNDLTVDVAPQPSYHALVDEGGYVDAAGVTGGAGYTVYWNPLAGEPYLFNPAADHPHLTTGPATVPTVITFSSPRSIGERARLIKALHLRGAMAWEISQDSDSHALIGALAPVLE
jgi:chitinase